MSRSPVRSFTCLLVSALATPFAGAANLLVNPGFEDGLSGWATNGNAAIRKSNPAPFEGENYVFGEATAVFSVSQTVDLLLKGIKAGDIDAGRLNLVFGGYQAGFETQRDAGQITVRLRDATGTELSALSTPSFFSNHTWVEQRGTTFLLPRTRSVSFEFIGRRVNGSNNDAYLDAAFVEVAPVPLPAALPLFGVALAGLSLTRRR